MKTKSGLPAMQPLTARIGKPVRPSKPPRVSLKKAFRPHGGGFLKGYDPENA